MSDLVTKTYDEWMAEDSSLIDGRASFHAFYGTRALQNMDRETLEMRILDMPAAPPPPDEGLTDPPPPGDGEEEPAPVE